MSRFHWIIDVFGAILIIAGIRLILKGDEIRIRSGETAVTPYSRG